jgi:hypothetical protein
MDYQGFENLRIIDGKEAAFLLKTGQARNISDLNSKTALADA